MLESLSYNKLSSLFFDGVGNLIERFNPPASIPLIDIGNHTCKMLHGSYEKSGTWNVSLYKEVPAPEEMVMSHLLPQFFYDNDNLQLVLRFFREEYLKNESYVHVNLPDSAFNVHLIKVSNILFRDVPMNAIKKELSLLLPFKINQYLISFQIIEEQELYTEVVVVSYLKNNLKVLNTLFQSEGLFPLRMECSIFNSLNSFQFFLGSEEQSDENIAVLHFSHESTFLTIFKNGKLKSLKRLDLGTDFLINAISRNLKLSPKNAQSTLIESAIFEPEYSEVQEDNPLFQAIRDPLLLSLEAIFDFFEDYLSRSREDKLDKILISGGLASMTNFHFLLENNFKIPVFRFGDLADIHSSDEADSKVFANSAAPLLGMLVR